MKVNLCVHLISLHFAKGMDFLDHIDDDLDFADGTVLGLQRGCSHCAEEDS